MRPLFLICLILFAFCSCNSDKQTAKQITTANDAITNTFKTFGVSDFSYLVASNLHSNSETSSFSTSETEPFYSEIINSFAYPLALKTLINNQLISENRTYGFADTVLCATDLFAINNQLSSDINLNKEKLYTAYSSSIDSFKNRAIIDFFPEKNDDIGTNKKFLLQMKYLAAQFQNSAISGFCNDTVIPNNYPTGYLNNIKLYSGWRVVIIDNNLVFWNYFEQNDQAILLLNLMNEQLFVGAIYPKIQLISPFQLNREDLLQSPLATALLSSLYQLNHSSSDNNKRNFISCKYDIAKALTYLQQNDSSKAEAILIQHDKSYPNAIPSDYISQVSLANFDYVTDDFRGDQPFEITSDTMVKLFTTGQVIKEIWPSDRVYGRDYINIVLKQRNGGRTIFRSKFYYKYPYDNGTKTAIQSFPFASKDIDDRHYLTEIAIPMDKESIDGGIEIAIELSDCDKNERDEESKLGFATNPSKLIFSKALNSHNNNTLATLKTTDSLQIDGEMEASWNRAEWQPMNVLLSGAIDDTLDNSGRFKTMWDSNYLYFLFEIYDQAKNQPWLITTDYCSIINADTKQIVWQTSGEKGSLFPLYNTNHTFKLKKGHYLLHYQTNDQFSFSDLKKGVTSANFYGAYLFIDKNLSHE